MKSFIHQNKFFLLLILIFIVSESIVNPLGNFPLNDDWTYAKSVLDFFIDNKYHIGTSFSSLWTHLMWGLVFTKIFGFSFWILRLSTILSSIVGLCLLFKLIGEITNNALIALTACLVMLFNPLYFNLTNTYMTDINFNTLLICSCYFIYNFYKTGKIYFFILSFLAALFLVLIRQFGIIVPFCITASCLFLKQRKWFFTLFGIGLTAFVLVSFKYYEYYIRVNNCTDGYPFSGQFSLLSLAFWNKIWQAFTLRYKVILVQVMVYTAPFLIIYLYGLIKELKKITVFFITIACCFIGFYFSKDVPFPQGNIFINMGLGSETFFQTLNPTVKSDIAHTNSNLFANIMLWLKCGAVSIYLLLTSLLLVKQGRLHKPLLQIKPEWVYYFGLIALYTFFLLISDTYFDRYHIPLFTLVIITFGYLSKYVKVQIAFAWIFIVFMFYVSVFGTKDYFTLNHKRWDAYRYLRFTMGVANKEINAGYEVNGWSEGKHSVAWDAVFVDNHNYLIQYRLEPEFKILKEYEFQRYFPYKKDKIYIFVREHKK
jgi:4-amino-4-deoxy-L-arabinose transferase-like glycosyltransferase